MSRRDAARILLIVPFLLLALLAGRLVSRWAAAAVVSTHAIRPPSFSRRSSLTDLHRRRVVHAIFRELGRPQ